MPVAKYLDPADGQWKTLPVPPHTHPGQTRIIGEVIAYAGVSAPPGWLVCDGSEQDTATYPDLSALLGTRFGAAAAGRFRLPDLRNRSVVGSGSVAAVGGTAGAETHGHTGNALPTHTHGNTGTAAAHTHSVPQVTAVGNGSHSHQVNVPATTSSSNGSHSHSVPATANTTNNVGSGSGSTVALGIHTHSSGSGGSHSHTVDPAAFNAGTIGDHAHTVPATTSGSGGSHAHTSTAVSGGTPSVQSSSSYHPVLGLLYIIHAEA